MCKRCKNADCTEEICEDKCAGHTVNENWDKVELNFMSFNILMSSSNGSDAGEVTSWTQRKEHVMSFINNSGAHVIGLQEMTNWVSAAQSQRVYFENNLADKYEIVYFEGYVNLAIVYDATVFDLLWTEQYWFSDTPEEVSSGWDGINYRGLGILMLEHKLTGQIVRAINTHGPLSDAGNVKAFEFLAERFLTEDDTLKHVLQLVAIFLQHLCIGIAKAEVAEIIFERTAKQKLNRHIVNALRALSIDFLLKFASFFRQNILNGHRDRLVHLIARGLLRRTAEITGQLRFYIFFNFLFRWGVVHFFFLFSLGVSFKVLHKDSNTATQNFSTKSRCA